MMSYVQQSQQVKSKQKQKSCWICNKLLFENACVYKSTPLYIEINLHLKVVIITNIF